MPPPGGWNGPGYGYGYGYYGGWYGGYYGGSCGSYYGEYYSGYCCNESAAAAGIVAGVMIAGIAASSGGTVTVVEDTPGKASGLSIEEPPMVKPGALMTPAQVDSMDQACLRAGEKQPTCSTHAEVNLGGAAPTFVSNAIVEAANAAGIKQ